MTSWREPSIETAREITGPEWWSGLDTRRDVLIWVLDELDARNGEIRCLKARIAALESAQPLPELGRVYGQNCQPIVWDES